MVAQKHFTKESKLIAKKLAYKKWYSKEENRQKIKKYLKSIPEKTKEWQKRHYQKVKKNSEIRKQYAFKNKLKRFNLTIEQYNSMFSEQNGECAICGTHQMKLTKMISIDHCHETGKVRGLLCQPCNSIIGFAKEKIFILESSIKYLIKHKTKT